ncbi:MAG: YndJ family transporter, partial [Planctomycetaceae bacterium]|nr:YndJ family transporter [Planctomycetaceae bacterium]
MISDPVAVAILLLAALVLVPLGLRLGDDPARGALARRVRWIVGWLQVPAAMLLASSFALDQGTTAAALAMPWLLVTLFVAAVGGLD